MGVVCDESAEPLPISYDEHTTDCAIDPAIDLDRFTFCGEQGDQQGCDYELDFNDGVANFLD